jgi:predicted permease
MNKLFQDIHYAARQLRKSPAFTAVAVVTLALGIAATTAIFSVVYGILLRPLPYADPNRIMAIFELTSKGVWNSLADPNFDDFRDQSRDFEAMAKYSSWVVSVSGGSEPTRSMVASVTPGFLKVFGVQPILGRDLVPADDKQGAAPVALVSYGYWKQYLGSARDLSGLHLNIDHAAFSVIGVLPDGFEFPHDVAVWVPADREGENPSRTSHNYLAVGRLRDGVTPAQANAEISVIARRIHNTSTDQGDFLLSDAIVVPLQDSITHQSRPVLVVLLAAVGFLLLIACANVANLLLAKISVRERELAIRSALGASRRRLLQQFVTESFLLSALAGSIGILGAYFGVHALVALAPQNLPRLDEVSINVPVLVFAFLLCSIVAVGIGAFVAVRATSGDVREGLTEAGRGQSGSQASQKIGRSIVAAQIAITLVLVIGAGLLGRSLMKVLAVDPGFRVDNIVTMDVSLPFVQWTDYKAKAGQAVFYQNLISRLQQIPGVHAVGAASQLPMEQGGLPNGMFLEMNQNEVPKQPNNLDELSRELQILFRQGRTFEADFGVASDGYFRALGIPLLGGRMFDDRDGVNSPHVAIISESLARQRWPGQDPIGHTLELGGMDGDMRIATVIGIVGDVHQYGLESPPRPTIYVDVFQRSRPWISIAMQSGAETQQVASAARKILHQFNPEIPPRFRTFSQVYSASLGPRRFTLMLISIFAGIAVFLAAAGVFSVMAYFVSRRTREIGVRVALGARPRDVLAMILGQGLRTALAGIGFGLVVSLALTRAIRSMLFGVKATDPLTFAAVMFFLVFIALLACYIPARRAAKVDPMVALRYE